jgi:hypothetical protein
MIAFRSVTTSAINPCGKALHDIDTDDFYHDVHLKINKKNKTELKNDSFVQQGTS